MTKTRTMVGDHWEGTRATEWEIEAPDAADLERAVRRLDAVVYTLVIVVAGAEHHLTVGGGAGNYVVVVTFDNQVFFTLLRSEYADGIVMVNAGGQEGDYPADQVVGATQALQAARFFLQTGGRDDTQQWSKSGNRDK